MRVLNPSWQTLKKKKKKVKRRSKALVLYIYIYMTLKQLNKFVTNL